MSRSPLIHYLVRQPFSETEMTKYAPHIHSSTEYGNTPLHFAALRKDTRFLSTLLRQGMAVNSQNYFNETPLHWAVKTGRKETVAILIFYGADTNALDSRNKSPEHWASEEEHTHLLSLFPKAKSLALPFTQPLVTPSLPGLPTSS